MPEFTLETLTQMRRFAQLERSEGCELRFVRISTPRDPNANSIFTGPPYLIGGRPARPVFHKNLIIDAGISIIEANTIEMNGAGLNGDMGFLRLTLGDNTLSAIGKSSGFPWIGSEPERQHTCERIETIVNGSANVVGEWPNNKSR